MLAVVFLLFRNTAITVFWYTWLIYIILLSAYEYVMQRENNGFWGKWVIVDEQLAVRPERDRKFLYYR